MYTVDVNIGNGMWTRWSTHGSEVAATQYAMASKKGNNYSYRVRDGRGNVVFFA